MSTIRGTSPSPLDSPAGLLSCLIPCPPDTPVNRLPFWRAVTSRDGTRIAIPIQITPEECRLHTWTLGDEAPELSDPFLSITDLLPLSNRDFSFLCQTDEGWATVKGHKEWELRVEFAWNLRVNAQGITACETQDERSYTPVVNGIPWSESYDNTFGLTLSATGERSGAVVQTVPIAEGDLTTFLSGCFTVATDEKPWSGQYVGAFTPALSSDGTMAAVDARISQYDYTIVVNDQCWSSAWPSVWAPVIHPEGASVCAPVKEPKGWTLACDGEIVWPSHYIQLWEPVFSPNGRRIAAVISPEFGKWSLALDGVPWKTRVDGHLSKPVFSPCGSRVGCTGRHKGKALILIDDCPMATNYDKAWNPTFSQYGNHAAARVKKGPWFTVLLNGIEISRRFTWMPDPVFTPDGKHLMICGIEKNGPHYSYTREFIALN